MLIISGVVYFLDRPLTFSTRTHDYLAEKGVAIQPLQKLHTTKKDKKSILNSLP